MVRIEYVGKKPTAHDNVANSRVCWNGNGDIQEVTEAQAKILLKFPDQWALADGKDQSKVDAPVTIQVVEASGDIANVNEAELNKPLEKMDKNELKAYAKKNFSKDLDGRMSSKLMIDQIEEWQAHGTNGIGQ